MSNYKKTPQGAVFNGFSGIDVRRAHSGEANSEDICNFSIDALGTLNKRCGFKFITAFGENIRAVWSGRHESSDVCVILHGSYVSTFSPKTYQADTFGSVDTSAGKGCFFSYRGKLYLGDGENLYSVDVSGRSVRRVVGYIPLIGKDWSTGGKGVINEQRNVLCDRARITYLAEDYPSIYLHTGWPAKAIDALYLNGKLVDPSDYIYNSLFKAIEISGLEKGDRLTAFVRYQSALDEKISEGLRTSIASLTFSGGNGDRVLLFGGNSKSLVYSSEFVSSSSLEASKEASSESCSLYFPYGHEIDVGDGRNGVTAALRHFDRILLFTENEAWNIDHGANGSDDIPLRNINTAAGCVPMGGAGMLENSPVSVGKSSIFAWSSETDEYNICNAQSISRGIDALLEDGFYEKALLFNAESCRQIWFHAPGEESTWVYNIDRGGFSRYTGFDADGFFEIGSTVWFFEGNKLYRFDPSLTYDRLSTGEQREICASFKSSLIDFSTHGKKRLGGLVLNADVDGDTLDVRIDTDSVKGAELRLIGDGEHMTVRRRLHSGRFDCARLTISASGTGRTSLHLAELSAR